ncbi:MAG: carbonic anhydrase [Acidobacteria bacterium]|nr:carbonic anhydrase [Acidobacteriota bacterium]
MGTHTIETQTHLTPREALEILQEGNRRFVNNLRANRNLLQQVNETAPGQFPFAAILSCIDSRTSAELIFDQGLGDIFSIRIAGNVVNEDILGSMEFACQVAGSKLIVVIGHSRCGAVKGACEFVQMGHLTGLLTKISPAVHEVDSRGAVQPPEDRVELVAREHACLQMRSILERSPILERLFREGAIGLACGTYSVETGEVVMLDEHFHTEGIRPAECEAQYYAQAKVA